MPFSTLPVPKPARSASAASAAPLASSAFAAAERALAAMDWRALLRQVCCPAFQDFSRIDEHDLGAAFFFPAPAERVAEAMARLRARCTVPPLFCSDMESGPGVVPGHDAGFPAMSGLGRLGSEEAAFAAGRGAALLGRAQGYTWTLAPVVDIALDIDSPMVSNRAAGETPEAVIPVARGFLRGVQSTGMAATAKHFPGDGFGDLDQHITTPVNPMDEAAWRATFGRSFQAVIDAGVACIMPGHIALPWADPGPAGAGSPPPATVSRRLLQGLLRDEMGFDGVIVSDAFGMGGVTAYRNLYDAQADFLEAGGDMILFARYDAHFEREMERRLLSGRLREETLHARARRLLALRVRVGLLDEAPPPVPAPDPDALAETARRVTEAAVEIVRDADGLLPLARRPARLLHVVIAPNAAALAPALARFEAELAARADHVETWADPGSERLFYALREPGAWDLVVVSLGGVPDYGTNVVRLHGPLARHLMDGWMHFGTPVVWVQHGHPYHHRHHTGAMRTVVNTHGSTPSAMPVLARRLFGDCVARETA